MSLQDLNRGMTPHDRLTATIKSWHRDIFKDGVLFPTWNEALVMLSDRIEEAGLLAGEWPEGPISLLVVSGVEGPSVYLNDFRIAGNKPWGGGKAIHTFTTGYESIRQALKLPQPPQADTGHD